MLPSRAPALPAPDGATLALLVQRVGASQGPAVADLYTWSQRDGRRRLLAATPPLPILLESLAWSNYSRWILLRVYPNDCKFQSWGGEVEIRPCERVALVDVDTGNVVYRSPAGLRPRRLDTSGGKLRIMTEPVASTDDFIVGGSGVSGTGKTVWRWYELDYAARFQALARGLCPACRQRQRRDRARCKGSRDPLGTAHQGFVPSVTHGAQSIRVG